MSNSSLIEYTRISPNKTSPRNHSVDRITPHCYVGQVSIQDMGAWLCNPNTQASANYGIGKGGIVGLFVDEKDRSWCSSNKDNDNRAITIECASEQVEPYKINDIVYDKLIDLMVDICQRYNKKKLLWLGDKDKTLAYHPAEDEMVLTVHRWFANKACPGDYIYNRLGHIADVVTSRLADSEEKEKIWRVRKTWEDEKSQKGAFKDLNSAIACADENPGYKVFDADGKCVYTSIEEHKGYTPNEWISMIAPITQALAEKYSILPSVVIAQTALETGWGTTDLTRKFNIIGMKADLINSSWNEHSTWDGKTYVKVTPEYVNGQLIYKEDAFREYHSFRECLEDYENFLLYVKNSKGYKYRRLQGLTDPKEVIHIIRIGTGTSNNPEGYCTDPNYETKILDLIKKYDLTRFDQNMPGYVPDEKTLYRVQVGSFAKKANATKYMKKIQDETGLQCFVEKVGESYKVYCGSFSVKNNAKKRADELQKMGIDAFVAVIS